MLQGALSSLSWTLHKPTSLSKHQVAAKIYPNATRELTVSDPYRNWRRPGSAACKMAKIFKDIRGLKCLSWDRDCAWVFERKRETLGQCAKTVFITVRPILRHHSLQTQFRIDRAYHYYREYQRRSSLFDSCFLISVDYHHSLFLAEQA